MTQNVTMSAWASTGEKILRFVCKLLTNSGLYPFDPRHVITKLPRMTPPLSNNTSFSEEF